MNKTQKEALEQALPIVTKQQAIALKELGFNWPVTDFFDGKGDSCNNQKPDNYNKFSNHQSAPTVELACMWLRDVHGLFVTTLVQGSNEDHYFEYWISEKAQHRSPFFRTFDESQSAGLDAAIEILKQRLK